MKINWQKILLGALLLVGGLTKAPTITAQPATNLQVDGLNAANGLTQCVFPISQGDIVKVGGDVGDFGASRDGGKRCHAGIDFYTKNQAKALAITDGTVLYRKDKWVDYNNGNGCSGGHIGEIIIEHTINGETKSVAYKEINAGTIPASLAVGSVVAKGDFLGYATNCGMLHLELWDQGTTLTQGWYPSSGSCSTPATGLNNPTQFAQNLQNNNCSYGNTQGGAAEFIQGTATGSASVRRTVMTPVTASVCVGDCPALSQAGDLSCWPVAGRVSTLPFEKSHGPGRGMQDAIDISDNDWAPIYASVSGPITYSMNKSAGCRAHVTIEEGDYAGYTLSFIHMQEAVCNGIAEGVNINRDRIEAGELLGYVGNTGDSNGPHLHYELVRNFENRNDGVSILQQFLTEPGNTQVTATCKVQ